MNANSLNSLVTAHSPPRTGRTFFWTTFLLLALSSQEGLSSSRPLLGVNSSMTTILPVRFPFIPNPTAMTKAKMDWYGTFRGRLGWTYR